MNQLRLALSPLGPRTSLCLNSRLPIMKLQSLIFATRKNSNLLLLQTICFFASLIFFTSLSLSMLSMNFFGPLRLADAVNYKKN